MDEPSEFVEARLGFKRDLVSIYKSDLELIMSCWKNFRHMDSLRIFSSKLALESLQALLEQFVEHQLTSLLFECVLIIGYQSHSEEIIQGRNFEHIMVVYFSHSINITAP